MSHRCSKRFMDVYFKHFIDRYTDEEVADRLCISVETVRQLKKAMEMRDKLKDLEVQVPIESKFGKVGEETRKLDFDVVQPSKLILISNAPEERQVALVREVAEKQLTKREIAQKVVTANIQAGKHTENYLNKISKYFECPFCGSKISEQKYLRIKREVKK